MPGRALTHILPIPQQISFSPEKERLSMIATIPSQDFATAVIRKPAEIVRSGRTASQRFELESSKAH